MRLLGDGRTCCGGCPECYDHCIWWPGLERKGTSPSELLVGLEVGFGMVIGLGLGLFMANLLSGLLQDDSGIDGLSTMAVVLSLTVLELPAVNVPFCSPGMTAAATVKPLKFGET